MSNYEQRLATAEALVHDAHLQLLNPDGPYPNSIYEPLYAVLNEIRDELKRVREAENE